ncbi:MAG TPA: hypothetical protein VKT29_14145, partial [Terriglobales bacterium]|nr:hypothetical protein [Terriglobales bacterium]
MPSTTIALLLAFSLPLVAQDTGAKLREELRGYRAAHEKQILTEFIELLSIPNHAGDTANIDRNAQ